MRLRYTIYPFAIASLNMALGWLLYRSFESVFGIVLVAIGLFVVLAKVGRIIREQRPVLGTSAQFPATPP